MKIGALQAAETTLRRKIGLCRESNDESNEAIGYRGLGQLLAYRSAFAESEMELTRALKTFQKRKNTQSQCVVWACHTLRLLLWMRSDLKSAIRNPHSVLAPSRRALELADETARAHFPFELDYVRAHWLMGAAYGVAGRFDEAEHHLNEALEPCRRSGLVEFEADILIDLARLRAASGAPDDAQRLAEEGSSSPNAAATSCKARMPTSNSPSSRVPGATSPPLAITVPKPAASPPATVRPILPTKPPTTRRWRY